MEVGKGRTLEGAQGEIPSPAHSTGHLMILSPDSLDFYLPGFLWSVEEPAHHPKWGEHRTAPDKRP